MKIKNKRIMIILGLILFITAWVLFFRWVNPKIAMQQQEGTAATHDTLVDSSMIDTPVGSGSSSKDFELLYDTRTLKVDGSKSQIWASEAGQEYTWSSSNTSVVKLETIPAPNMGHKRYLVAVSEGTSLITATCGPQTHSVTITVTGEGSSFSLSCAKTELSVGETIGIMASDHDQEYTWTTSDSSVVDITNSAYYSDSYAKTLNAKKAGTATITATSGSKSKTITITVTGGGSSGGDTSDDAIVTYTPSVTSTKIEKGTSATVTLTPKLVWGSALPTITYSYNITWTSSSGVVSVSQSGNSFIITGIENRISKNRILG